MNSPGNRKKGVIDLSHVDDATIASQYKKEQEQSVKAKELILKSKKKKPKKKETEMNNSWLPTNVHFMVRKVFSSTELFRGLSSNLRIFIQLGGILCLTVLLLFSTLTSVRFFQEVRADEVTIKENLNNISYYGLRAHDFLRVGSSLATLREKLVSLEKQFPQNSSKNGDSQYPLGQFQLLVRSSILLTDAGDALSIVAQNVKQFLLDAKSLPNTQLRLRYRSLSTFFAFQWKYIQENALPKVREASLLLEMANKGLPAVLIPQLSTLTEELKNIQTGFAEVEFVMPRLLSLLGDDFPRTYVVLLQNSSEARATGGFIGSIAIIKLNDGWIDNIEFRDVYDYDGQIVENLPPPPGIEKLASDFRLRDANYWPDFPTSAKQVAWFLDKAKGPGIDGVFAITDSVIINLLKEIGPVAVAGVDVPFTEKNFSTLMSYLVESKVDKLQPKTVLFTFAENFLPRLFSEAMAGDRVLDTLLQDVAERSIVGYSFQAPIQELIEHFGMDGRMYQLPNETRAGIHDYLLLADTSIGGNKSDKYIEEQVAIKTASDDDGSVNNTITIARTHTWNAQTESDMAKLVQTLTGKKVSDTLAYILGRGKNVDYLRVYVPEGAKLTGTRGIEMSDVTTFRDLGKTVFAYTHEVNPGETKEVSLQYTIPMTGMERVNHGEEVSYFLMVEKQPGGKNIKFTHTVDASSLLRIDTAEKATDESVLTVKNKQLVGKLLRRIH